MAKIKQVAIKETCVAGRTIEHVIKLPSGCHKGKRAQRMNATPENVKKINDIVAERNFRRLINHNFGYGSGHYTLTYGHLSFFPSITNTLIELQCSSHELVFFPIYIM